MSGITQIDISSQERSRAAQMSLTGRSLPMPVSDDNKHDVHHIKAENVDTTTSYMKTQTTGTGTTPSSFVAGGVGGGEAEWRREWRPDLKCCPWKVLQESDHFVYLMKANFLPDSYEFLITDLNHFWFESITHTHLLKKLQELNPNLEAPTCKILEHIKSNLEENSSESLSISKEESNGRLHLWINSDLAGFPFYWQMIGEPAPHEMVSENTTIPLFMMVSELFRRQKQLVQIISEKDKEIENYKSQGCKITKRNLSTVPFDETVFERSMVSAQEFEDNVRLLGTSAFESSGQDLYQQIMTKYSWLHRTANIDEELLSKSSLSLEEPNTVFQQLAELSASVEGRAAELVQVGKVDVDDDDDEDVVQVPIYGCPQCIFSTVSQDHLVQHISVYHSESFVNHTPNPVQQQTSTSISLRVTSPLQLQLQPLPQIPLSPLSPLTPQEDNPSNSNHAAENIGNISCQQSSTSISLGVTSPLIGNIGNISCQQCGQRYQTQYGLQSHMNSKHFGKFLFNCSLCGRGFDSYRTYKAHIDRHGILAEKCERCNLTFRFKKSLVMHLRFCGKTKHQGSMELYRCQICEQTCSSKDSLSTHMHGQHGSSSQHYRCRRCNKVYKWRSSLKYHTQKCFNKPPNFLRTHTDNTQSMLFMQV